MDGDTGDFSLDDWNAYATDSGTYEDSGSLFADSGIDQTGSIFSSTDSSMPFLTADDSSLFAGANQSSDPIFGSPANSGGIFGSSLPAGNPSVGRTQQTSGSNSGFFGGLLPNLGGFLGSDTLLKNRQNGIMQQPTYLGPYNPATYGNSGIRTASPTGISAGFSAGSSSTMIIVGVMAVAAFLILR